MSGIQQRITRHAKKEIEKYDPSQGEKSTERT